MLKQAMEKKLKSPQALAVILGGGIVAISVAGFGTALLGFGLPFAGELVAGLAGMAIGAKFA